MKRSRTLTVYATLLAAWVVICLWQLEEHRRMVQAARAALLTRARDISYSVGTVIRSLGPSGLILQPQLEEALEGLTKSSELLSVALLNSVGEVVASAGKPLEPNLNELLKSGGRWGEQSVAFVNLIDLGGDEDTGDTSRPTTIILPPPSEADTSRGLFRRGLFAPPRKGPPRMRGRAEEPEGPGRRREPPPDASFEGRGYMRGRAPGRGEPPGGAGRPGGPPHFGRPPWMEEADYQNLLQKRGLHGFVLTMSMDVFRMETSRDRWLRLAVGAVALVAALGLGLAWRSVERSARLQMRLVRADEMNLHLQEMNLAAAGLAHETRNPLNIVRGLAQMITKHADAPPEIRRRSVEITEEVDRVTERLSEFMDYSRPREPRLAPTSLHGVVRNVARALESDKEEKALQFALTGPDPLVEADEPLLRQLLFNLLLNSMQAVSPGGRVEVLIERSGSGEVALEVRDNGPGVPEELRENIFRPYFTTRERGTGLGLALVRQIVLAHGWEIEYLPGENGGARFRITGLKTAAKAS